MKFKSSDLMELATNVKDAIELHEVKPELKESLLSDILFQVATLIDEKQGSSFHESIFNDLENYSHPERDYLVSELDIYLLDGEIIETNILKSNLTRADSLCMDLEVLFEFRNIDELDKEIDVEEKFKAIHISKLLFKPLDGDPESFEKEFTCLNELVDFIKEMARKWV